METLNEARKYERVDDVRPREPVTSRCYQAPFDEGKILLESEGYDIISLEENARLRIQEGKDAWCSGNGNCVREGVIYIPGKGNKLVRNSPILYSAKEATHADREGKEFYTSSEAIEKALEDSVDFPLKNSEIPANRFNEDPLTVWAFGRGDPRKAQDYGDFLIGAGIKSMPVYTVDNNYVNRQKEPFVRQQWFGRMGGRSFLGGDGRSLCIDSRVRGVSRTTEGSEATEKFIDKFLNIYSYAPEEISEALNDLGLSSLEKSLLEKLENNWKSE